MPKIKINDIEMYYETMGKGEPLVFVSGFTADHLSWLTVLNDFAQHFQVILFDNRGVGRTDAPTGPYSISQMAQDVVDLCAALKISSAHFVGSSMGGFIVQQLAYQHPSLVKSIVIGNSAMRCDSSYYFYPPIRLKLLKENVSLDSLMQIDCCLVFSYFYLSQPGKLEETIRLRKSNPYPVSNIGYEAQYAALATFDSREWISTIAVPTLILSATHDVIFSNLTSQEMVSKIKNAQFHCFENCGHVPHLEYPKEYLRVVGDFLKTVAVK